MNTGGNPVANSFVSTVWISLVQALHARDRKGREHAVTVIKIRSRGYIPDVYVQIDREIIDEALYDDETFVGAVIDALRTLGYQGKPFDRAELGMQGRDYIVLEPGTEFRQFVIQRFGWHELDARVHHLAPSMNASLESCDVPQRD
jgi:hypothetical protein